MGGTRERGSSFPTLRCLAATPGHSQGHSSPISCPKETRPLSNTDCHLDVAPGTIGKGLRAAAPLVGREGLGAPSSFELRSRNQSLVKLVGRPVPRLFAPL